MLELKPEVYFMYFRHQLYHHYPPFTDEEKQAQTVQLLSTTKTYHAQPRCHPCTLG